jgi:hypothetical protein
MTKQLFYKKVQTGGRPRYEPVSEYDSDVLDSVPYNGTTLIHSYKNGQARKFNIEPALVPMVAASMILRESLTSIISKASEYKPRNAPITPAQRKAWDALNKSFGGSITSLDGVSVHDIAESILEAISDKAEELLTNAAVKASYEEFLMIAALSKNHDISTEK